VNKKVLISLVLLLFVTVSSVQAQGRGFYNRNSWKKQRIEWSFGGGVSNFLGDLGGRDLVGSDFLWDLELSKTKMTAHAYMQYYLGRSFAMRTSLSWAKVAGDDALTQEIFRYNRNLNFVSNIFEASLMFELQFKKERIGNIYNLKSGAGKRLGLKSFAMGFYGVFGVGGFYYNPWGMRSSGQLVELRPLHTEGQGLPGGPEQYSNFSVCIPVGLGVRRSINREWGFKVELTHRWTFTDYIDEASTYYYDPAELMTNYGGVSAEMANPTNQTLSSWVHSTSPGQQRGDPSDKDGYMFLTVTFYKRAGGKNGSFNGYRHKVRRVKASF